MNKLIKICVLVLVFSFLTVEVSIGNITSAQDIVTTTDTNIVGNTENTEDGDAENTPPVVDAGPDQTITLPDDSVTLDGSGSSDPDGEIVSYVWSFGEGPSNIDPADVPKPTIDGLLEGKYIFILDVIDNDGDLSDTQVSITVNPAPNTECDEIAYGAPGLTGTVNGGNAVLHVPEGACDIKISFTSYEHAGTIVPLEDQILTENITAMYGPGEHHIGPLDLACNWQTDLYVGELQYPLTNDGHSDLLDYDLAENQDCNPGGNVPPVGFLDAANCDIIGGWAYDPNTSDEPIIVEIYANGPKGVGTLLFSGPTTGLRPDVNEQYGITGNHGYTITTPESLKDGADHAIWVYAQDSTTDVSTSFAASKTLNCGGTTEGQATISITKIVCPRETDLPNMSGGANITSTTAANFIAQNPQCRLEPNWKFQGAYRGPNSDVENPAYPGDAFIGEAGSPWITIAGSTNTNGVLTVSFPVEAVWHVWIREVLKDGYIPFASNGVSAEMYCGSDVLNYDNIEKIDGPFTPGSTVNCVAFNVQEGQHTPPQCSDDVDNDDTEDTLIDELDPGCHTDGDPENPESYDRNDDDETDESDDVCPNIEGTQTQIPSGMEKNSDGECVDEDNNGGGGGGGGSSRPQCSDNKDNNDPEDTLEDEDDPGCHTDGNPNNPDSYDRRDRSERDTVGEVLGAETACGIYVEEYLRVGYANDVRDVVKVQMFLNMYMNAGLATDGVYGPLTEAAVRNFQLARAENVLSPWTIAESTGIFYLTTQTEVNNIMCPELGLDIPSPLINWSMNTGVDTPAPNPGTTALYLNISGGAVLGESLGK